MDKVATRNSPSPNEDYDVNSCEPPTPELKPSVSCPDGSEAHADSVCEQTGLKGPATALQRFLAAREPNANAAGAPSSNGNEEAVRAQQMATVDQAIGYARDGALGAIRDAIAQMEVSAGQSIKATATLPNGCKVIFEARVSLEEGGGGKPNLVVKVSGSIEGTLGAVSGSADLYYSRSTNGQEEVAFRACVFGGANQDVGIAKLELRAGVCGTYSDAAHTPAQLAYEAIAKAGAGIHANEFVDWGHKLELRYPLGNQEVPFEVIH